MSSRYLKHCLRKDKEIALKIFLFQEQNTGENRKNYKDHK